VLPRDQGQQGKERRNCEVLVGLLEVVLSHPPPSPSSPPPSSLVVQRSVRLPSSLVSAGLTQPVTQASDRQGQFKGLLVRKRGCAGWMEEATERANQGHSFLSPAPPSSLPCSPLPHVLTLPFPPKQHTCTHPQEVQVTSLYSGTMVRAAEALWEGVGLGWRATAAWRESNDDEVDEAMGGVQAERGHADGWGAACMRITNVVLLLS